MSRVCVIGLDLVTIRTQCVQGGISRSTEESKAIVRCFIEAMNERDVDTLDKLSAPDLAQRFKGSYELPEQHIRGELKGGNMVLEIFAGSRDQMSFFLRSGGRIAAYLCIALAISIALTSCGPDPPAETPTLVWGAPGAKGYLEQQNVFSDPSLYVLAVDNVIQPDGADYTMGFYFTIRRLARNRLKASYNNVPITWVEAPDTQQDPRPYNATLAGRARTGENLWWSHRSKYVAEDTIDETLAIVIGAGNPNRGVLEFWTESRNPEHSGTDAVSERLGCILMPRDTIRFDSVDGYVIEHSQKFTLKWNVAHAEEVRIWGPGIGDSPGVQVASSDTRSLWAPDYVPGGPTTANLHYDLRAKVADIPGHFLRVHRLIRAIEWNP